MNKKDLFIKQRFKQDKEISDKANKIFENIKEEFELENEKKGFKVGWKGLIATVVSVAIVTTVGISLVQKSQGKPNLISKIEALVKKEDDIKLNKHIDSEIGVSFDYPEEWVGLDNNRGSGAVGVWLMPETNEEHVENVYFWVSKLQENTDLSPRKIAQNNNSFIGVMREGDKEIAGNKGYYVETKREYTENLLNYEVKTIDIYVVTNYGVYNISYSGDEKLYDKYYKTFEKMLETIKFSKKTVGETSNTNENVQNNKNSYVPLSIDTATKKVVDPEISTRYITNNDSYNLISISIRDGRVYFSSGFSKEEWVGYGIAENQNVVKISKNYESEITGFNKKVIDAKVSCNGQSIDRVYVVFLMEDGTLEYSTIQNLVKNSSVEGKVNNVSNIQRIYNCSVGWGADEGGMSSVEALDKDNNLYDVGYVIFSLNNR